MCCAWSALSEQDKCVCGRPLGHDERKFITEGAGRFLAQDQISIINQMKLALRESEGDDNQLSTLTSNLQQLLTKRQQLRSQRDRLTSERIAEGDQILASLKVQREELLRDLKKLEEQIERLTTRDPQRASALRLTWENNLPRCLAEEELRRGRLDTATKTRTFSLQGEMLKKLIKDTSARALEILRGRVQRMVS